MLWKLSQFFVEHLSRLSNAKLLSVNVMRPPTLHIKSKSALLAASSSSGLSLSFFEGKHIASIFDLLPLEEGVALVLMCTRRPSRWK